MTKTPSAAASIFLVEDEVMIRMMIAEMLEELGHSIGAEAGGLDEAIRVAQATQFDLVILDVNFKGQMIIPVAKLITDTLKRPIIFATGYGEATIPEGLHGYPSLQKPFTIERLGQIVDATMKRRRSEK